MYEAPIHLIYDDIKLQLDKNVEDCVYSAVQNVGVNVDRDELIRALKYDREQYDKGYNDGKAAACELMRSFYSDDLINLVNESFSEILETIWK